MSSQAIQPTRHPLIPKGPRRGVSRNNHSGPNSETKTGFWRATPLALVRRCCRRLHGIDIALVGGNSRHTCTSVHCTVLVGRRGDLACTAAFLGLVDSEGDKASKPPKWNSSARLVHKQPSFGLTLHNSLIICPSVLAVTDRARDPSIAVICL